MLANLPCLRSQVEASAVRLPEGTQLRDLAWYKGGQLALTLQRAAQPAPYSALHLLATSYLVYVPVPPAEGATALQVIPLVSINGTRPNCTANRTIYYAVSVVLVQCSTGAGESAIDQR